MSEEVIKILDALAEKFGLAIDWTSANVLPYLQQLCGKYITYEIATSVIWMLIGICLLFVGKYSIKKTKQYWQKSEEEIYSDYDVITVMFGILTGCVIVGGIVVILCQTFDIVTCITFPEKIIIEELQSVYSSLK
mgnify:FL=1